APAPREETPLFVRFPYRCMLAAFSTVTEVPGNRNRWWASAAGADNTCGNRPDAGSAGITTSVELVGINPHQFPSSFQSEETAPVQVPDVSMLRITESETYGLPIL